MIRGSSISRIDDLLHPPTSRTPAGTAATNPPITQALLDWYDRHRRALPWRSAPGERPDPYAVWLSEIMLQQTTVQAVKPFFAAFLARWATVQALAEAPVDEVMRAWAGLGYYSRARNLHACAISVMRDHGGAFPDTEAALRTLPGIGPYTAAAIAAIAFGRNATVVDGNVERVMIRFHAIETAMPQAKAIVYAKMSDATPPGRAGDFAQAVMDLGATICTPKSPACTICPITVFCAARQRGLQLDLPRRKPKAASPLRHGIAHYIVNDRGDVLVRRRPPKGLLGGMVELPGAAWTRVDTAPPLANGAVGRVTHVFTHFTLLLDVVRHQSTDGRVLEAGDWWVTQPKLQDEALPTLMRNAIALAER